MFVWRRVPGFRAVWLASVALGLGVSSAFGGLEWETTVRRARLRSGQAEFRAEFPFVNRGGPLEIRKIHTSCGCTVAKVGERCLAAGERGSVEAVFRVDSRRGRQRRFVRVETDDPVRPFQELVLDLDVPEQAWVGPRLVWWCGGPREPRCIEVRPAAGVRVREVRARAVHEDWGVEVRRGDSGGVFRVEILPPTVAKTISTVVAVSVDLADDSSMSYPVFARVFEASEGGGP